MDDRIKQSDFVCISTLRTTFLDEKLLKNKTIFSLFMSISN